MWRRGRARQETHARRAPQKSVGSAGSRSQNNGNTFPYLKPTDLASLIRLQTSPSSPTCPARGPAARTYPALRTLPSIEKSHSPGRSPLPRDSRCPPGPPPGALAPWDSRPAGALLANSPGPAHRAFTFPPRAPLPCALLCALPDRRALLYRALAHARCTSLPRAHQPGLGHRNAQSARPAHLKGQAPAPEPPVVASRRAPRSPCDV